ncbi:MAG: hypothetical protein JWQ09_4860 [Segetibacter sp.]|nr:hypothetical protein [Segetibacter sp.]
MTRLLIILTVLTFVSCGQTNKKSGDTNSSVDTKNVDLNLKPFELIVYDADYSMAYTLQYILTDKDLKIIFKGELQGEKDSTLFKTTLQPNEALNKLSNINIDSLKESYSNPCIMDGSQVTVKLNKDHKSKTVHLSNYYQTDIGLAIELINSLTPKEYKIWYDKAKLLEDQENCK